jgi:hypothetical protein
MFHLVVCVMGHGNRVDSKLLCRHRQKIVPQFSASHFQRQTLRLLKSFHIAAADDNFETELPG